MKRIFFSKIAVKVKLILAVFFIVFSSPCIYADDDGDTSSESSDDSSDDSDSSSSDDSSDNDSSDEGGDEDGEESGDGESDDGESEDGEEKSEDEEEEDDSSSDTVSSTTDVDGNLCAEVYVDYGDYVDIDTVCYEDVFDSNGDYIYDYDGNGDPEAIQEALEEIFSDMRSSAEAAAALSRVIEAMKELSDLKDGYYTLAQVQELEEKIDELKAELDTICSSIGFSYNISETSNFGILYDSSGKIVCHAGDPVIIATGDFIINDYDLQLWSGTNPFCLSRHYSTGSFHNFAGEGGFLGRGWISSLETRIIRACSKVPEEMLSQWENYYLQCKSTEESIKSYFDEDSECSIFYDEVRDFNAGVEEELLHLKAMEEECNSIMEKNKYVLYGWAEEYAKKVGSNVIIYSQDNGGIILFYKNPDGSYSPSPAFSSIQTRLEVQDDGYVITYPSTGEKRCYNDYGLPKTFFYKENGRVDFFYDENMKINRICIDSQKNFYLSWEKNHLSSITDEKSGKKISYSYKNALLSSVTDENGNVKSFEYDDDAFITRQIKGDSSFVSFAYQEIDGKKRVVSTKNEEGYSEFFSYDIENRTTKYTDQDGVTYFYTYDEKGRTIMEKCADGSFKEYEYNDSGLLSSLSDNYGKILLFYDNDKNLIKKLYPDSSWESWTYVDGLLSSRCDRDGVCQNYFYDSQKRMTDLYHGGKLLFHYEYDQYGNIIAERDCRGNQVRYKYDSDHNITGKAVFASGAAQPTMTESMTYDLRGRIKSLEDSSGLKMNYTYSGLSLKVSRNDNIEIEESYSPAMLLLERKEIDKVTGEKRIKSYTYDKNKNCREIYLSGRDFRGIDFAPQKLTSFTYTPANRLSSRVDYSIFNPEKDAFRTDYIYSSDGSLMESRYGPCDYYTLNFIHKPKSKFHSLQYQDQNKNYWTIYDDSTSSFTRYDFNSNMVSQGNPAVKRSEYEYSPAGRLLRAKKSSSSFYNYLPDPLSGYTMGEREEGGSLSSFDTRDFYADGKILSKRDRRGGLTQYSYDERGNLVKIKSPSSIIERKYDDRGQLLFEKVFSLDGLNLKSDEWTYEDRKVSLTESSLYSSSIFFNAFAEKIKSIDGEGNEKKYDYNLAGQLEAEYDSYGEKIQFSYDARRNLKKITYPDNSFVSYEYDCDGNRISARDCAGLIWQKSYDCEGRLKSIKKRPFFTLEEYEYDDYGNVRQIKINGKINASYEYSADGRYSSHKDSRNNARHYYYDGFGRILKEINALGAEKTSSYNEEGSLLSVCDFNGQKTFYSYSEDSLREKISLENGDYNLFVYDPLNKLLLAENNSSRLSFTYNKAGLLEKQLDKNGEEINFSYNKAKKLTKIGSKDRDIYYKYGKNGELLEIYSHQKDGMLWQNTRIRFIYDKMGRELLRVYDSGHSLRSLYDDCGRLILRQAFSPSMETIFLEGSLYDEGGAKIFSINENLEITAYSYDERGRLSSVSYPFSQVRAEKMKEELTEAGLYFLEENSQLERLNLSQEDYAALESWGNKITGLSFRIDPFIQVLRESFEYDDNNNLIKRTNPYNTINYTYDGENRLVKWGNAAYALYDKNGNMLLKHTQLGEVASTYNDCNRQEEIKISNFLDKSSYVRKNIYDPFGRKISEYRSEEGLFLTSYLSSSLMIFSRNFTPSQDFSSSSGLSSLNRNTDSPAESSLRYKFIGDDRKEVNNASSLSPESPCRTSLIYDWNGNIASATNKMSSSEEENLIIFTDSAGSVRGSLSNYQEMTKYDYDVLGSPLEKPIFAFAGKIYDGKSGSSDFGYRDYQSQLGRFTSQDPLRDGKNWYSYCQGNPVMFYDPDGLYAKSLKEQNMQDMGAERLGNSDAVYDKNGEFLRWEEDTKSQGCLVTALAEALTALTGIPIPNSYINSQKDCFNTVTNKGDISWDKTKTSFGVDHKISYTSGNTKLTALDEEKAKEHAKDVKSVLEDINKSDKGSVVVLQAAYNTNSYHFVGATGEILRINDKDYAVIVPTSRSDRTDVILSQQTKNTYRGLVGWQVINGKPCVPLSIVKRVDEITKAY